MPDCIRIRELRKKLNLSQKELGEKVGIKQSTISRIENGELDPPYSKFKAIYEFLEKESRKRSQSLITANDIMTRKIYYLTSDSTVKDAIELMNKHYSKSVSGEYGVGMLEVSSRINELYKKIQSSMSND
ncbi:MAG: helix-turn-helix domain-containing protein, partial [Candidatus Thorarchaeota archaeon]